MPKEPAMSNADREFEFHNHCWFVVAHFAFCSVAMCIWGIAVAFDVAPCYTVSSVAARVGYSCLFESLAVLLGFRAIRWTTRCVGRSFRLVFTDTAIVFTEGTPLWSRKLTSILYADVRKARCTRIGRKRTIKIVFPGGRFPIYSSVLRKKEDFDELLGELTRRLKPFDTEVENHQFSWRRPQFSLRFMLVVTTVVAATLGCRRYLDPELDLSDLVAVLFFTPWILISIWGGFFAGWQGRIFAIGFASGLLLEIFSIVLLPNSFVLEGPYPFCLALPNFVESLIGGGNRVAFTGAMLGGATISGAICGAFALVVSLVAKRAIRSRSNRKASSDS